MRQKKIGINKDELGPIIQSSTQGIDR
jgi:hypothetical protein